MNNSLLFDLMRIHLLYKGGKPTIRNQGQSLDGFSALSAYDEIAEMAKECVITCFKGRKRNDLTPEEDGLFELLLDSGCLKIRNGVIF